MSTPARRRLMRDFRRLQQDPPQGVTGAPMDEDIMKWNAVIFGPDDTPWEGGTFKLTLTFSEDYPNKPPQVKFITKMFHPNIYANGQICLDILQNQWSPIYDIAAILTSIQSLLTDPNPNSPANVEAAKLYQENRREYDRKVMEFVETSWSADDEEQVDANKEKKEKKEKKEIKSEGKDVKESKEEEEEDDDDDDDDSDDEEEEKKKRLRRKRQRKKRTIKNNETSEL